MIVVNIRKLTSMNFSSYTVTSTIFEMEKIEYAINTRVNWVIMTLIYDNFKFQINLTVWKIRLGTFVNKKYIFIPMNGNNNRGANAHN